VDHVKMRLQVNGKYERIWNSKNYIKDQASKKISPNEFLSGQVNLGVKKVRCCERYW